MSKGPREQIVVMGEWLRLVDPTGRFLYETPEPPDPDPGYVVVDVQQKPNARFWANGNWCGEMPETGISLKEARAFCARSYYKTVVAPCRPADWIVVAWDTASKGFMALRYIGKSSAKTSVASVVRASRHWPEYIFPLDEALAGRDKIMALNDPNLVDIRLACLDMMVPSEEGA